MADTPVAAAKSDPAKTSWRNLPRNVWVVTITSFLTDISSEMTVNLLPLYLANVLGVGTSVIGLIEGVAETTASLAKIFSGWISDSIGRRKWLTVFGYSLSTISKPFLYVANSWGLVLAVRFSDRLGKGIRTAPRDALIADSVAASQRGLSFGLHRAGDTAGAMLGLLLALVIVWHSQADNIPLSPGTFQMIVLVSIVPAVLAVGVLAFGAQESLAKSAAPQAPSLSLRDFDRRFKLFLLAMLIFTLGNSSDAFLVLRAQERGLNVPAVLGMLAVFNLIYALISGPAGALSDRVGRRGLIIAGWLLYALVYLGFALANTAWQVWVLYACYGLYYGLTDGVAKALVADLVPPDQRGTAYGVFAAVVGLGTLPASLMAGLLWQGVGAWSGFGPQAPFWFGSGLALLALVLLARWLPHPRSA